MPESEAQARHEIDLQLELPIGMLVISAEIVENLEAALEQMRLIAEDPSPEKGLLS